MGYTTVKGEVASAHADDGATLNASLLHRTLTTVPRPVPSIAEVSASEDTICTDHMVLVQWQASTGWETPQLQPYGPLNLMPTTSCLHYATQCFEGLKAYRGYDGRLRVFRIDRNVSRLLMSADRLSLPLFDPQEVKKLILALLSQDAPRWLPRDRVGEFLYIRPSIIGTHQQLGLQRSRHATLFILTSFMSRLDSPSGGLRLLTSPQNTIRSWVGGFGHAKIGANYGPTIRAQDMASARGFSQVLWLHGDEDECTEAGGCNFCVVWKRESDGKRELITAPLDDKVILDGVTRRSCLELAKERFEGHLEVSERKFSISEVIQAGEDGRLLEAFVCGTAVSLCLTRGPRTREVCLTLCSGSLVESLS